MPCVARQFGYEDVSHHDKAVKNVLYVEDVIVPLIAIPTTDQRRFRFIGSGFYVGKNGHLVTCRHVVDNLAGNEQLAAYQIGKRKTLQLDIIRRSEEYDLALCKSSPPGITEPWPIIDKPYVTIGCDVEVYGYWYEPLGQDELPFRQRYMRGYITGIPIDPKYPDSFELNFPILFGMSGSPLIYHAPIEDESKEMTGIAGCVYGSMESTVVKHSVVSVENQVERVARIVELGLAYMPSTILSILPDSGITINIISEEDHGG